MRSVATVALWIVRLGGLAQIALGLLFWFGRARALVPWHIRIGLLVAVSAIVLAIAALAARTLRGPAVGAILLAVLAVGVGFGQLGVAPGAAKWAVQGLHFLIGLALLGLGDRLGRGVGIGGRPAAA